MGMQIHLWAQTPGAGEKAKSKVKLQRSIKATAFSGLDPLLKKTVVGDGSLISWSAVSKFHDFVYQNQNHSLAKDKLIISQIFCCTSSMYPSLLFFWIYLLRNVESNFKQKNEGQTFRKQVELYSAVLTKKSQTLYLPYILVGCFAGCGTDWLRVSLESLSKIAL